MKKSSTAAAAGRLLQGLAASTMVCGAQAGPALEQALEELEAQVVAPVPAPHASAMPEPDEGLVTAPWGPGADAPWLVAGGATSRHSAHLVSGLQTSGPLRWRAGFAWREGPQRTWSLDGSLVAWSLGSSEFYASAERRHWGPGWMGSLILDGAAPALAAVGWRRTQATSTANWRWLGPWTADVFVGRLQGHQEPQRPLLIGTRLQFEPLQGLQIGLARTLQWGGAGRDENLRSLWRGLLGRDNLGSNGVDRANEPGNQLAGIDWRWSIGPAASPSFYGQVVGEDEAGMLPSRNMLLLGLDAPVPMRGGSLRLFAEAADTIAGDIAGRNFPGAAYRHHAFAQGYTQLGAPLGHPAGGDVRLLSVGAILQRGALGAMATLSLGHAEPTAQRFAAGRVGGLNAVAHVDVNRQQRVGTGLWWWRDRGGARGEAQLWWQHRY